MRPTRSHARSAFSGSSSSAPRRREAARAHTEGVLGGRLPVQCTCGASVAGGPHLERGSAAGTVRPLTQGLRRVSRARHRSPPPAARALVRRLSQVRTRPDRHGGVACCVESAAPPARSLHIRARPRHLFRRCKRRVWLEQRAKAAALSYTRKNAGALHDGAQHDLCSFGALNPTINQSIVCAVYGFLPWCVYVVRLDGRS